MIIKTQNLAQANDHTDADNFEEVEGGGGDHLGQVPLQLLHGLVSFYDHRLLHGHLLIITLITMMMMMIKRIRTTMKKMMMATLMMMTLNLHGATILLQLD